MARGARGRQHLAARLDAAMGRPVALRAAGAAARGVEVCSTGVLALDFALGIGGYPYGRVVEIFGDESVGKTTLLIRGLIEAQRMNHECLLVDMEHAIDFAYAERQGVDLDKLAIAQPDCGEDGLELARQACIAGARFIGVDSVAALLPRAIIEGEMDKAAMGSHARLMSQGLGKLIGAAAKARAVLVFINQTRSKIGVMYGSPRTTTGGNALKFYSSVRIDLRVKGKLEATGKRQIGIEVVGKVIKNKCAPPMQEAKWGIVWGQGIDRAADLINTGLACGVLGKRGANIDFGDVRVGGSMAKAVDAVGESEELALAIEAACRQKRADAVEGEIERHDPEVDPDSVDLSEEQEDGDEGEDEEGAGDTETGEEAVE